MLEGKRTTAAGHRAALGLAWMSVFGCGPWLALLRERTAEEVWQADTATLLKWGWCRKAAERFRSRVSAFDHEGAETAVDAAGLSFIPLGHPRFPQAFKQLACPPAGLFIKGDPAHLDALCSAARVTIVGTRRCSPYGSAITRVFASAFASAGITIVSGLALGIDGRAHAGCLQAKGETVAILGSGADVVYPRANGGLYKQVAREGLVASELPPGAVPTKWTFPNRNRLLAALGDATLVVEAGPTSGALQTADWALALGRPVFAVPGYITVENCRGCNTLIAQGAFPALDAESVVDDFLRVTVLERGDRRAPAEARRTSHADGGNLRRRRQSRDSGADAAGAAETPGVERAVSRELGRGALSVDQLAERLSLTTREVLVALAHLELNGSVVRAGPGMYVRAP